MAKRRRVKGAGSRWLARRRSMRLLAEPLEDRRLLALGPVLTDLGYGRVDPAWFSSLPVSPPAASVTTVTSAGASALAAIQPGARSHAVKATAVAGEWIVRLSATALSRVHSVADAAAFLGGAGTGVEVVRGLGLPGQLLVRAARSGADVAAALRGVAGVSYVSANTMIRLAATPNDPSFGQLYGLDNRGQAGGTADADIDAPEAWDIATGSKSTVVGVVDTGIDWTHPDLAANVWTNPGEIARNGIDDDHNGFVDDVHGYDFANGDGDPLDDHGHGTHVAGTIGAVGNNGTGVVGVNWDVSLMGLKFLDASGSGTNAAAIQAINYATMMRSMYGVDIRVLNNSWGGGGFDQGLLDAINASNASGILFVAAAGNSAANVDATPFYPAAFDAPNVVSVAATDSRDALAGFSNYGKTTVDLAAPGVNILSTVPGGYGTMSGTSMASPHVAGVAALAAAANPGLGVAELKGLLLDNVDPVAALAGKTATGGRLNAEKVVRAARQSAIPPSISGTVYEDIGGDSVRTAGDPLLRGVGIFVDTDGDGEKDPGEPATLTSGSGGFAFAGLAAGAYVVRTIPPAGWAGGAPRTVTVAEGAPTTGVDFGVFRRNAVYGRVVEDFDGGGTADAGEPALANQRVFDDVNGNGLYDTALLAANSGTVNLPIRDFRTTTSPIVVTGQTQKIIDLNVVLTLTHTWNSDLLIELVAPDGTIVTLSDHRGYDGDNYTGTVFDDQAARSIVSGVAPFTGSYRPEGSLAAVNGLSPNGTWSLRVSDDYFGDVGTLVSWSLAFTTSAEQSTTSNSSGFFTLTDVAPGSHSLRLAPGAGFVPSGPAGGVRPVSLADGETVFGTSLTAARAGSIAGRVFSDTDADGVLDTGEPGIAGVTVYVDANVNGLLDASETRTQTGAAGVYRFTGRAAGVHTIRSIVPAGLGLNAPATGRWTVTLPASGVSFNNDFALVANRAPTDVALSPAAIVENAPAGTVVGTLRGIDPDIGDPQSFSLVDGDGAADNASFTIVAGQLRSQASFDFESRSSYSVRVRTTDSAGLSFERPLAIAITNANDAPTAVVLSKTTVPENAGPNAVVGTLSAVDQDAGDAFTFALVAGVGGDDNARFNVSGTSLRASASFDYETRSSYSVRLRATDRGGRFAENVFSITVTDVNDIPLLGGITGPVPYVEKGVVAPVPAATVFDIDSADFDGGRLTVAVAANANVTDRLEIRHDGTGEGQVGVSGTVVSYGGVTVGAVSGGTSGTVPLVVTFNAAVTPGVAQAVLRNVQYRSTSDNPWPLTRTLSYTVNDGDGGTSAAATQVIAITPVNDAPILASLPATISYTENAVLLPAGGVLVDPDSPNFDAGVLTVAITANGDAGDRLAIRHQGTTGGLVGVSGSNVTFSGVVVGTFTAGTATTPLTVAFNVAATPTAVQAVVRNVAYTNASDNPVAPLTRSLSWQITDGDGGTSPLVAQTVTIVPVNDVPVVGGITGPVPYVENGVVSPAAAATVFDIDSVDFAGGRLTVAVAANANVTDRLEIRHDGTGEGQVGVSGTVVSYGGVTVGAVSGGTSGTVPLVVTFNAAVTPGVAQAVLRNVQYRSTSDNPWPLTRTLSYTVNDGDGGTSAAATQVIAITPVNDAPALATIPATVSYTENAVLLPAGAGVLVDPDSATFDAGVLTVSITANGDAADRLTIRHQGTTGGLVGVSGTNVTFSGVVVGTFTAGTATTPLTVAFNASATPTAVQAVVRNVSYASASDSPVAPLTRSLSWQITDGDGGTSPLVAQTVTIVPVNDVPVLGGITGPVPYVENGVVSPVPAATVFDIDSADFAGGRLTVAVAANANVTDRLEIRHDGTGEGQVGVSGTAVSYGGVAVGTVSGGTSGTVPLVVTFNAAVTPGVAQAVLRNVQYRSTSDNPWPLTRTLSYTVNDGDGGTPAAATQVIAITAVNDAPALATIPATVSYTENAVLLPAGAGVLVDPDSANFDAGVLTVSITANGDAADRLTIRHQGTTGGLVGVSGSNVTFGGVVVGTFSGGTVADGTAVPLTVAFNASATPTAVQAVVRNVSYTNPSDNPVAPLTRSLSWQITDGDGGTSPLMAQTVTIVPVNDAPVVGGVAPAGLAYAAGSGWLAIAADATVADVDSPRFGGGTLSVALVAGGLVSDRLAVQSRGVGPGQIAVSGGMILWGGATIGSWTGGTGTSPLVIALNAAATPEAVQALLRSIAYSNVAADPTNGGVAVSRSIRFTLSDAAPTAGGLAAVVTMTLAVTR